MKARHHRDRLTDEAADWFVRAQDPDMSTDDRVAFADWLTGSSEHVREYLLCTSISMDIGELSNTPDVDELIRAARCSGSEANVFVLSSGGQSHRQGSPRLKMGRSLWAGGAVLAIIVLASILVVRAVMTPDIYSTGVGEQLSFQLEDGSVITLNTLTGIQVEFGQDERSIQLITGEALFNVAKDPQRPFRVHTDHTIIRAIGTLFNVRQRGEDTTVTVVEGTIDVRPPSPVSGELSSSGVENGDLVVLKPVYVAAGHQVTVFSGSNQVIEIPAAGVERVVSWRERRLEFSSKPLSAVVDEFNLYNDARIVLRDSFLADRLVSGSFSADDRESFVLFLAEAEIASYEKQADGTLLLSRPEQIIPR